jgi:hypothetical protein
MTTRKIVAALSALALAGGMAGGCGRDDGDREGIDGGGQDREIPEGTPSTVETGPAEITPPGDQTEPGSSE